MKQNTTIVKCWNSRRSALSISCLTFSHRPTSTASSTRRARSRGLAGSRQNWNGLNSENSWTPGWERTGKREWSQKRNRRNKNWINSSGKNCWCGGRFRCLHQSLPGHAHEEDPGAQSERPPQTMSHCRTSTSPTSSERRTMEQNTTIVKGWNSRRRTGKREWSQKRNRRKKN